MVKPQWLGLLMSRTNFHGPKDVRAIEVRHFLQDCLCAQGKPRSACASYPGSLIRVFAVRLKTASACRD